MSQTTGKITITALTLIATLSGASALASDSQVIVGRAPLAISGDDVYFVGEADKDAAYLGVQLREEIEHPEGGARVVKVVEDSPADAAGLEDGDIILSFDGQVIRGPVALTEQIHARKPGDRVSLTVDRDGVERVLEVELGERASTHSFSGIWSAQPEGLSRFYDAEKMEQFEQQAKELSESLHEKYKNFSVAPGVFGLRWGKPLLGVQLVDTTPELRQHLGSTEGEGVLVSKVVSGSPAEHSGILVGDLIVSVGGTPVSGTQDLRDALAERVGETFNVDVIRDRKRRSIEVTIPDRDEDEPTGPRAMGAPCAPAAPAAPCRCAPAPPAAPRPVAAPRPARPVAPAPPVPLGDGVPRSVSI